MSTNLDAYSYECVNVVLGVSCIFHIKTPFTILDEENQH